MVKFAPGFCFSAVALDGTTRMVVNVCGHDSVGRPLAKNMTPVDDNYLDERGIDNLIIPISVSQPVALMKGSEFDYRVDVVIHTCLTKRCVTEHHFFGHYVAKLTELAVNWVKQECGIVLVPSSCALLGTFFFDKSASKDKDQAATDLLQMTEKMLKALREADQNGSRDDKGCDELNLPEDLKVAPANAEPATKPRKCLVQEVVANHGIKKGFLLNGNNRLYGEEGSCEGEGPCPDPLAHIPESLRGKCKIIDTRNMDPSTIHEEIRKHEEGSPFNNDAGPVAAASSVKTVAAAPLELKRRWRLASVSTSADATVIRVVTDEFLKGVGDIDLTVTGSDVTIDDFQYTFLRPVNEDSAKAKYVKSSKTLVLTCPFA